MRVFKLIKLKTKHDMHIDTLYIYIIHIYGKLKKKRTWERDREIKHIEKMNVTEKVYIYIYIYIYIFYI